MRLPILTKLASLALIALLLLFALERIDWLVRERMGHQAEAERGVQASLAESLAVLGPYLHRRCTEQWDVVSTGKDGERLTRTERREFELTSAPSRLGVSGDLALDPLHRGLFKVNTFGGRLAVTAQWNEASPMAAQRQHAASRVQCDAPTLSLSLADPRAIRSAQLQVDGQARALRPGARHRTHDRGFHAALGAEWDGASESVRPLALTLALDVVGTGAWSWVPAAGQSEIALRANWPHPSFGGHVARVRPGH
jgi:inner membrane protein